MVHVPKCINSPRSSTYTSDHNDTHIQLFSKAKQQLLHYHFSMNLLERQLDLYLERFSAKDKDLERDITKVCMKLSESIKEAQAFLKEVDVLKGRVQAVETAKFLRQRQHKDLLRLMTLMISMNETELSMREKDIFAEKLKGWLPF